MKNLNVTVILVLTFLFSSAQTKNFIDQPYVDVTGSADTLITPDEIFIKILISEKDSRDKNSVEDQENKMVEVLKALGIDTEKDLTTNDMLSNFKNKLLKGRDIVKSKTYILKVNNATTASNVFISLEDIGISNTSIDRVNHTELEKIKNIVRVTAVENARERAIEMAKPLGQNIGNAIYIGDAIDYYDQSMRPTQLSEVVVTGYGGLNRSKVEPTKIDFDKLIVRANVNVKFVLKGKIM